MSGYFFQQGNISVDATMAKFGMTSYPIANIGSVSVEGVERMAKQIALGALMLLIGIFTIFTITIGVGIFLVFLGVIIIVAGVLSPAKLILRTSSGDQQAFASRNKALVWEIKSAIEAAIASRG